MVRLNNFQIKLATTALVIPDHRLEKKMDDASPLPSTVEKRSRNIPETVVADYVIRLSSSDPEVVLQHLGPAHSCKS